MRRRSLCGNTSYVLAAFVSVLVVCVFVVWVMNSASETPNPDLPPVERSSGLPLPDGGASGGGDTSGGPSGGSTGTAGPSNPPVSQRPRLRTAWITEEGVQARRQPGLNMELVRTLTRWEEVRWIKEQSNWDLVTDEKGDQFWIESRFLTFARPANLDTPSVAEQKVMDFYARVARKDYSEAYRHLSPEWKRELSYKDFVDGYSRTLSLRSEISSVVELGKDRFQVDVAQVADEEGADIDYLGSYTVEPVDGRWMLTSGILKRLTPSGRRSL